MRRCDHVAGAGAECTLGVRAASSTAVMPPAIVTALSAADTMRMWDFLPTIAGLLGFETFETHRRTRTKGRRQSRSSA